MTQIYPMGLSCTDIVSLGIDVELSVLKRISSVEDSVVDWKRAYLRCEERQVTRLSWLYSHSLVEVVCYREPVSLGGVVIQDVNDYVPVNGHVRYGPWSAAMLAVIVSG